MALRSVRTNRRVASRMLYPPMMKKPPIGSTWRILVQQPEIDLRSSNYRSLGKDNMFEKGCIFDELVIVFAPDPAQEHPPFKQHNLSTLHLEQMDERNWYLGVGDLKYGIHVEKDGALSMALYGSKQTKFEDVRGK